MPILIEKGSTIHSDITESEGKGLTDDDSESFKHEKHFKPARADIPVHTRLTTYHHLTPMRDMEDVLTLKVYVSKNRSTAGGKVSREVREKDYRLVGKEMYYDYYSQHESEISEILAGKAEMKDKSKQPSLIQRMKGLKQQYLVSASEDCSTSFLATVNASNAAVKSIKAGKDVLISDEPPSFEEALGWAQRHVHHNEKNLVSDIDTLAQNLRKYLFNHRNESPAREYTDCDSSPDRPRSPPKHSHRTSISVNVSSYLLEYKRLGKDKPKSLAKQLDKMAIENQSNFLATITAPQPESIVVRPRHHVLQSKVSFINQRSASANAHSQQFFSQEKAVPDSHLFPKIDKRQPNTSLNKLNPGPDSQRPRTSYTNFSINSKTNLPVRPASSRPSRTSTLSKSSLPEETEKYREEIREDHKEQKKVRAARNIMNDIQHGRINMEDIDASFQDADFLRAVHESFQHSMRTTLESINRCSHTIHNLTEESKHMLGNCQKLGGRVLDKTSEFNNVYFSRRHETTMLIEDRKFTRDRSIAASREYLAKNLAIHPSTPGRTTNTNTLPADGLEIVKRIQLYVERVEKKSRLKNVSAHPWLVQLIFKVADIKAAGQLPLPISVYRQINVYALVGMIGILDLDKYLTKEVFFRILEWSIPLQEDYANISAHKVISSLRELVGLNAEEFVEYLGRKDFQPSSELLLQARLERRRERGGLRLREQSEDQRSPSGKRVGWTSNSSFRSTDDDVYSREGYSQSGMLEDIR